MRPILCLAALLGSLLALASCAPAVPKAAVETAPLVWPPDPDPPRIGSIELLQS
jgi:hypothetical protein